MKIVLPRNKGANHGLHKATRSSVFYVRWTEDGKQRIQSTGTKDAKEARQIRDRLYERFEKEKGAVRVGSTEHVLSCDRYVYQRPPYLVKVPGRPTVECDTRAEARQVRNQLIGATK